MCVCDIALVVHFFIVVVATRRGIVAVLGIRGKAAWPHEINEDYGLFSFLVRVYKYVVVVRQEQLVKTFTTRSSKIEITTTTT